MDYRLDLGCSAAGVPLRWENASNGHIALLGQSGRGKSFTMRNLLAQLPEQGVHAYVFDYSGDFRGETARSLFARSAAAVDVRDVRQQARINPFRSLRLSAVYTEDSADTSARLTGAILDAYQFRGSAQPLYLRSALTDFMTSAAFQPSFEALASFIESDESRASKMQASLIRLKDLGRMFSCSQEGCDWGLDKPGITILQFDTIQDRAAQVLVTELLLSDLWAEKLQAQQDTCPIVVQLDECQRFCFDEASMLLRILREGRKYHINGWFASQWLNRRNAVCALEQAALRAYFYPGDRNIHALARALCPNSAQTRQCEDLIRRLQVGQFLYTDQTGRLLLNCVPPQ
ncbi:ATP-binding protein [Dysosmobacter sp. HCP28S3_G4]|uniref:ATP-binding protein n=1 Tax=Dysosmobacter sp. HCP28S3_G4 TaxID=3438938 RepID=UPI003F8C37C9